MSGEIFMSSLFQGDGMDLFGLGHRGDVKFSPARKISLGKIARSSAAVGGGNHARSRFLRPVQAVTQISIPIVTTTRPIKISYYMGAFGTNSSVDPKTDGCKNF